MFLCKRVRSEVGVDSVGVGGGEPGGVRGRCAPVGGDPPRRRVHPLALREWAGVFFIFGALRGPAVLDVADPPATAVRAAASSEGKWPRFSADRAARWLGDSIALVVQR